MRDQDQRRVLLGDELAEKIEDLRLDRHVERGGRLVCNQQLRLTRERHRDHRALAHSARELVRVVAKPRPGARNADAVDELRSPCLCVLPVQAEMRLERFANLPSDRQHGIERRHRVLEDHRDLTPADPAENAIRLPKKIAAGEHGLAATHTAISRQKAEYRKRCDALPAAGLSDDAQRLARRDLEVDPVDGVHRASPRRELDAQIVHGEQRLSSGHATWDRALREARPR